MSLHFTFFVWTSYATHNDCIHMQRHFLTASQWRDITTMCVLQERLFKLNTNKSGNVHSHMNYIYFTLCFPCLHNSLSLIFICCIYRVFRNRRSSLGRLAIKKNLQLMNYLGKQIIDASWHFHQSHLPLNRDIKYSDSDGRTHITLQLCVNVRHILLKERILSKVSFSFPVSITSPFFRQLKFKYFWPSAD
jgi:hypothetical protein